ncbi:AraC family transcriptional regulator [Lactococcus lactis]|uniref:AraC family transcriptional regulator n=1 Tax=Lactococcus lactis TaxID=1358 RepID=UPI002073AD4B|nr:AraC family transcriptional regulator [Lactococcus lactis]
MEITDETWEIIKNNDKNFDNKLWYGVATTKIFCRPCKRCRPMDKIIPNEVWVEEIDLLLKNHYDEDLSLEELGQRLHGSSSYLRHIYKKIKGLTPQQELTRIRLEQARIRLLKGNEAISEIARDVGMMNTPYFIKSFKKRYGLAPNQYRKAYNINSKK